MLATTTRAAVAGRPPITWDEPTQLWRIEFPESRGLEVVTCDSKSVLEDLLDVLDAMEERKAAKWLGCKEGQGGTWPRA